MEVSSIADRARGLALLFILALALAAFTPAFAAPTPTVEDVFASIAGPPVPVDARLITDNHQAWYARYWLISGAQKTIDSTYFQVASDVIGRAFLGLLLKKAQEGVKIRLMVDNRGTFGMTNPVFHADYLPALATFPNVEIRVYNPFTANFRSVPAAFLRGLASNHSKLLIVDGQRLVAGGRNLTKNWYAAWNDDPHAVFDADVLARGESLAAQARGAFEEEWGLIRNATVKPLAPRQFARAAAPLEAARKALYERMTNVRPRTTGANGDDPTLVADRRDLAGELESFATMRDYLGFVPFPAECSRPVVLLGKHSAACHGRIAITDALIRMIDASRDEITLANPYMVLTDRAKAALKAAGARGVKIRYVTNSPESTDSIFTQAWFVKEWKDYLRDVKGLRIFAVATNHKLHGKVFVFDRKVAALGSYNMDPMSEQINAEDLMLVRSTSFASECLDWIDELGRSALEYRIKVLPDGTVQQLSGPSDHCSRWTLILLGLIGSLWFLRPVV